MNGVQTETKQRWQSDQLHLLHIYLRDHEAAAVGGLQLFRRCTSANRGSAYGADLQRLTDEIREDRDALRRICRLFGVKYSIVGRALAYSGATLGRVKTNGRIFRYSPLSRVLELEALSSGVMSKLRLWESLVGLSAAESRLAEGELSRLASAANAQLETLRRLHDMAAREAFA
jgi:hypothetical protein